MPPQASFKDQVLQQLLERVVPAPYQKFVGLLSTDLARVVAEVFRAEGDAAERLDRHLRFFIGEDLPDPGRIDPLTAKTVTLSFLRELQYRTTTRPVAAAISRHLRGLEAGVPFVQAVRQPAGTRKLAVMGAQELQEDWNVLSRAQNWFKGRMKTAFTGAVQHVSRAAWKTTVGADLEKVESVAGKVGLQTPWDYVAAAMRDGWDEALWNSVVGRPFSRKLREDSVGILASATNVAQRHAINLLPEGMVVGEYSERINDFTRNYAARMVLETEQQSTSAVREAVLRALTDGVGESELARRVEWTWGLNPRYGQALDNLYKTLTDQGKKMGLIRGQVSDYKDKLLADRAEMLANTETMVAMNFGRQLLWEDAVMRGVLPVDTKKVWVTAIDERVCPICAPMDSVSVALNASFVTKDNNVIVPPAHPRCRCTIVPESLVKEGTIITRTSRRHGRNLSEVEDLRDQEEVEVLVGKHLRGEHDQKEHGNWARQITGGASLRERRRVTKQVQGDSYEATRDNIVDWLRGKSDARIEYGFVMDNEGKVLDYNVGRHRMVLNTMVGLARMLRTKRTTGLHNHPVGSHPAPSDSDIITAVRANSREQVIVSSAGVATVRVPDTSSFKERRKLEREVKEVLDTEQSYRTFRLLASLGGEAPPEERLRHEFLERRLPDTGLTYQFEPSSVRKHYGPGPHPGTGTPQVVHTGLDQAIAELPEGAYDFPTNWLKDYIRGSGIRIGQSNRIKNLANSILESGFTKPITIWVYDETGKPFIRDGMHRLEAAHLIGLPRIPVAVHHVEGEPPRLGVRGKFHRWRIRRQGTLPRRDTPFKDAKEEEGFTRWFNERMTRRGERITEERPGRKPKEYGKPQKTWQRVKGLFGKSDEPPIRWEPVEKHLPGQHDQDKHGRKKSGSADFTYDPDEPVDDESFLNKLGFKRDDNLSWQEATAIAFAAGAGALAVGAIHRKLSDNLMGVGFDGDHFPDGDISSFDNPAEGALSRSFVQQFKGKDRASSLYNIESSIKDKPREYVFFVREDGDVLGGFAGKPDSARFEFPNGIPRPDRRKLTLTHNHPAPSSTLSRADVAIGMKWDLGSVRATTLEGNVSELQFVGPPMSLKDRMAFLGQVNQYRKRWIDGLSHVIATRHYEDYQAGIRNTHPDDYLIGAVTDWDSPVYSSHWEGLAEAWPEWVKFSRIDGVAKHLLGRHSQKTHGRKGHGKEDKSVPQRFLNQLGFERDDDISLVEGVAIAAGAAAVGALLYKYADIFAGDTITTRTIGGTEFPEGTIQSLDGDEVGVLHSSVLGRFQGQDRLSSLRNIEREIRDKPREFGFLVGDDGSVLAGWAGTRSSIDGVALPGGVKSSERKKLTFTHNHPSGGTLSPSDVLVAMRENFGSVRAVTPGGGVSEIAFSDRHFGARTTLMQQQNIQLYRSAWLNSMNQHVMDNPDISGDISSLFGDWDSPFHGSLWEDFAGGHEDFTFLRHSGFAKWWEQMQAYV